MRLSKRVVCLAVFPLLAISAELPAFPGAEGFGCRTPGGRRGRVLIVENLNDSGPGSLRAACEAAGPRMVVFRVAGILDLKSPIVIREPFITIAGQSAPGDGVCLRGYGLVIDTHDVVVRFLRVRPGDVAGKEVDAIAIGGASRRVVVDHCSASWAVDEVLSPSGNIADVTVQWCIIAEALHRSVHHKGPHGYGSLVRASGGVSLHHNLWAHNYARNPRLGDNYGKPPYPLFDVRNNVMYDYGALCSGLTGEVLEANYVANYIKPGPSSRRERPPIAFTPTARTRYYVEGNVVEGRPDWSADNRLLFDRPGAVTIQAQPFPTPSVTTTSAREAFEAVLANAGAIRPARDAVDQRIVEQARRGTGRIIDSPGQVGGWPEYRTAPSPRDTDRDGMPDDWEKARGLDPNRPADAAGDRDGDGYTNLEEFLNELAQEAAERSGARLRNAMPRR